ncbi:MAG: diguanylate cyclase [Candidatus Bipolaricaulota bacterium]|nr:diguanylate cyclase [Candidatus Bipolaricaulota bacterium]
MKRERAGRILIIDADTEARHTLSESVRSFGHDSVEASGAEAALDILVQHPFDAIILSIEENNLEKGKLIPEVRQASPQAGIIVITDTGCSKAKALTLHQGADYCLGRPIAVDRLRETLDRSLDRCRAFQSLEEELTRYERLVMKAPIGVFEIDVANGTLSFVNDHLLDLGGYHKEDLIGHSPQEFVAREDRERFTDHLQKRMEDVIDADTKGTLYTFYKKYGETILARVESRLVETPDGPFIEGTLRDVTSERRLAELQRTVAKLGESILAAGRIDNILQSVLDAITKQSGFRRAVVSLYDLSVADPFQGAIHKILSSGLSPTEVKTLRSKKGLTTEERKLAFADRFRLGPAYYIPHDQVPWSPDLGLAGTTAVEGWHADDFLFLPLRGESGIIGHLSVDDPIDRAAPTLESIVSVAALANFAALAVERIYKLNALRKQKERLHGLFKFSRQLSQVQEIGSLCSLAAERLQRDMDYEMCAIWLKDGVDLSLEGIAAQGSVDEQEVPKRGTRMSLSGDGLARWVIEHDEPTIVPDVRKEERYKKWITLTRSEVDVPIHGRTGALGSISVESGKPAAFGKQDLEIITSLANQLSVAISNLKRKEALAQINSLGQKLTEALTLDQLTADLVSFLAEYFNRQHTAILLYREKELIMRGINSPNSEVAPTIGDRFGLDEGILGWVAQHQCYALVDDVQADPRYAEVFPKIRSELAVPITIAGQLLGVLNVESEQVSFFDEEDRRFLEAIAAEGAIAIANLTAQEQLRQQAVRDPLTQLYNRHYFNEVIRFEIERADRYDHPVALMMLDIDGFRAVNNHLGHLKGDEILCSVAKIIEESVRTSDRVIRYGGDEFLILMPETDGDSERVHTRLKGAIERLSRELPLNGLSIGLSIGTCTRLPHDPRTLEEILEEADQRMYADKRATHADQADDYDY